MVRASDRMMVQEFDDYDLCSFGVVAAEFGLDRYGYVVTPNVDHMIRLCEDESFRSLYSDAAFTLLDSRFLSMVLRITRGLRLPVCPGSDLTRELVSSVIHPNDSVVLVGSTDAQAQMLRDRHGLRRLAHYNPPMGFIHSPQLLESCLQFVEQHSPFRFCLIAVGSPQQEIVARELGRRGIARGLALCIGASVNFLTGQERRAPRWLQRCGLEWAYRLARSPRRLAKRYLVRGPRIFWLLRRINVALRPL